MSIKLEQHVATKGDSFSSIARRYNVNYQDLLDLNQNQVGNINGKLRNYTFKQREFGIDPGDVVLIPLKEYSFFKTSMKNERNINGMPFTVLSKNKQENTHPLTANQKKSVLFAHVNNEFDKKKKNIDAVASGLEGLSRHTGNIFSYSVVNKGAVYLDKNGRFAGLPKPTFNSLEIKVGSGNKYPNVISTSRLEKGFAKTIKGIDIASKIADISEVALYVNDGEYKKAEDKMVSMGATAATGVVTNGIAGSVCPVAAIQLKNVYGSTTVLVGCYVLITIGGQEVEEWVTEQVIEAKEFDKMLEDNKQKVMMEYPEYRSSIENDF